jgi:hypothetical protein
MVIAKATRTEDCGSNPFRIVNIFILLELLDTLKFFKMNLPFQTNQQSAKNMWNLPIVLSTPTH